MAKRRNLNGLPHNLTKSFFGTERYYMCGYMADWILNAARRLSLSEATIDILKEEITPKKLNLHPLLINIKDLKPIIQKELLANGFTTDFIVEAKIRIEFLNPNTHNRTIYCYPYLVDKDGHKYEPGRIIEDAFEDNFNPFDSKNIYLKRKSLFEMIKSKLLRFDILKR